MTSVPRLCVPFPFSSFLASSFQKIPSLSWLNARVKDFVQEIKGGVGEGGSLLFARLSHSSVRKLQRERKSVFSEHLL